MDQKFVKEEKGNLKCNNTKMSIEFQITYNHNIKCKCTIEMVLHGYAL